MTTRSCIWLACLCLGSFGCTLADTAVHNAFLGPCDLWNDHHEDGRNRALAQLAWKRVCCKLPDAAPDYRDGFIEGYADYLKYGGNGEPPAVVPARYRREQIRTGTGWSKPREAGSPDSVMERGWPARAGNDSERPQPSLATRCR